MAVPTYLDRPEAGSVTGGHILVQGVDSGNAGHLTVLLVHVVGTGAGVVADPDAEVLDLLGALLGDLAQSASSPPFLSSTRTHLVQRDDLTVRLLDLAELAEEVPEPRLGDNIVGRKNTHAVDLGGGVGLAGEVAADDLVFLEASCGSCQYCVLCDGRRQIPRCPAIAVGVYERRFVEVEKSRRRSRARVVWRRVVPKLIFQTSAFLFVCLNPSHPLPVPTTKILSLPKHFWRIGGWVALLCCRPLVCAWLLRDFLRLQLLDGRECGRVFAYPSSSGQHTQSQKMQRQQLTSNVLRR